MNIYCRECDIHLVINHNWTVGNAEECNYICRDCSESYDRSFLSETMLKEEEQ